jgi:gamma-glutamyltranspeptidase / glutathione hydrolase
MIPVSREWAAPRWIGAVIGLALVGSACAPSAPGAAPRPVEAAAAGEVITSYAGRNRPDVSGTAGAVVAGHPLAAAAGYEVLRAGGNAVDAAVTMAAVLAVVRPHMNGVGGDAFALFYDGQTREVRGLNGSGRSGAIATPEFFEARNLSSVPGSGPLSVTVPGAVSAWAAALERLGTIPLARALEPAIRYAEEGFVVTATLEEDLEDALRLNPAGREIFAPGGVVPAQGTLLRNPALGRTLRLLAAEGPQVLYGGAVGKALADFVEAEGGYLRAGDFAAHTAEWTEPISTEYAGLRVYGMPPSTQGVALLQQMALSSHFPLAGMGHNSADYLHSIVEVKKVAFADRDRWIADPTFAESRVADLLDPGYIRSRARLVGSVAASSVESGFGTTAAFTPGDGSGDTVYLMAVDQWGNGVSWIQSLFGSFGSRLVEPTTGVVLQNRGGQFTLNPDHPNRIAPGKRPYHTLTPHLATDAQGRLALTFGTPGGDGQTQTLIQVFNNIFLFGMSPQEAVEAPRYRSSRGTDLALESRVPLDVRAELVRRGHDVSIVDGWSGPTFGGAQVILVDPATGVLRTGADPRREAYGIAY